LERRAFSSRRSFPGAFFSALVAAPVAAAVTVSKATAVAVEASRMGWAAADTSAEVVRGDLGGQATDHGLEVGRPHECGGLWQIPKKKT
jgi:hypothetical protein